MIRRLLLKGASWVLNSEAKRHRLSDREKVHAKARQLCEEMGKPVPAVLRG